MIIVLANALGYMILALNIDDHRADELNHMILGPDEVQHWSVGLDQMICGSAHDN